MPASLSRPRAVAFASLLVAATGCGATAAPDPATETPAPAPTTPVAVPTPKAPAPPLDHGSVSTTYPAFAPNIPQLTNKGGKVLANPVVVTITWNDDPNVAAEEAVADTIGASDYWRAVVGEYGVGAVTSGAANHVHLTTPLVLPTGPDADPVPPILKVITDALADPAASGWPAPTDQSVYLAYITGAAAKQLCDAGAGGLHDTVTVSGKEIPFAISAACADPMSKFDALQEATISASHELAEVVVDPFPDSAPGWQGLGSDRLAWELLVMGQDENGDLCELYDDVYGMHGAPQLPFAVQRTWSNKSAAAGHAPCVPAPKDPNFNVTTLIANDTVVANFAGADAPPLDPTSLGYVIGVGQSRTIPLGFYSDGPTAPIAIEAFESDPFSQNGSSLDPSTDMNLELSLDKVSGQNGEKAYLTIKVVKDNAAKAHLVVVQATVGNVVRYLPILVGTAGKPATGRGGLKSAPTSSSASGRRASRGLGRR